MQPELVEGRMLTVQWFERDRLEIQPNGNISAGRLGVRMLETTECALEIWWQRTSQENCVTFPQTGYRICDAFAKFWQKMVAYADLAIRLPAAFPTSIDDSKLPFNTSNDADLNSMGAIT
jgi:hypothetical protein